MKTSLDLCSKCTHCLRHGQKQAFCIQVGQPVTFGLTGCPLSVVGDVPPGKEEATPPVQKQSAIEKRSRAEITAKNIIFFLATWTTKERISDAAQQARREACGRCEFNAADDRGTFCGYSGGCGCSTSPLRVARGVAFKSVDLTLYGEKPGKPLCRHPKRGQIGPDGKSIGWPREAVLSPAEFPVAPDTDRV